MNNDMAESLFPSSPFPVHLCDGKTKLAMNADAMHFQGNRKAKVVQDTCWRVLLTPRPRSQRLHHAARHDGHLGLLHL